MGFRPYTRRMEFLSNFADSWIFWKAIFRQLDKYAALTLHLIGHSNMGYIDVAKCF